MNGKNRLREIQHGNAEQLPSEDLRTSASHQSRRVRFEQASLFVSAAFERTAAVTDRTCSGDQVSVERSSGAMEMRYRSVSVSIDAPDP